MTPVRAFVYGAGLAITACLLAWWGGLVPAPAVTASPSPPPSGPAAGFAEAVARAAPSVASLRTRRKAGAGQTGSAPGSGSGSAVAVTADGALLTSLHVVADAEAIEATLVDGRSLSARLLGGDPDTDIAALRLVGEGPPPLPLGRAGELRVGDLVLAIGNPFGVGQAVSHGVVSATGRNRLGIAPFENFIQTDAAINPGSSGGALVNARGELVGINTAIYSESGGSHGIGFAVPADLALGVLEQIVAHGQVRRGWLGITGQDVTPAMARAFGLKEPRGVLVSEVSESSPAQRAGVRTGDLIAAIDGQPAASSFDVLNLVASRPPGAALRIGGWRGVMRLDLQVVLGERPAGLR
jgi:S1-C subfamily serine protease